MTLPAFPTRAALHELYAGGTPLADVIAALYARIAAVDDPGIFITLLSEQDVLKSTEALGPFDPKTKPLWGSPSR